MPTKFVLRLGLFLVVPMLYSGPRAEAGDGLFSGLHHGSCDDQKTTVRLPAQQIQIVTTRPQVVVNSAVAGPRYRTYLPAAQGFMPMFNMPMVATVLPLGGVPAGNASISAGNGALDAIHALDRQHMEFAAQKAVFDAQRDIVNKAYQRFHASLTAPAATPAATPAPTTGVDPAQLQKALDNLASRIDRIETLLLLHDKMLQDAKKPSSK